MAFAQTPRTFNIVNIFSWHRDLEPHITVNRNTSK